MLTRKLRHASSFFLECTDFKKEIFEKIPWAHSEDAEVAEWIFSKITFFKSEHQSFSFNKFSFIILVVLDFEVVWPRRPRRPQNGPREFFQKLHFWNQCIPRKTMRHVSAFKSTFSLNLSTEEGCGRVISSYCYVLSGQFKPNKINHSTSRIASWLGRKPRYM